jgi:hypothetical protein
MSSRQEEELWKYLNPDPRIADLLKFIEKEDEENVNILLEEGVEATESVFTKAYEKKNYKIIDLLFKYKNYEFIEYDDIDEDEEIIYDSYVQLIYDFMEVFKFPSMKYQNDEQAEHIIDIVIDNYSKKNVLDKLIEYEQFNSRIINIMNFCDKHSYNKYYDYVTPEMYNKIKNKIKQQLFSLLFRSCAMTEVKKLREKLRRLKIDEIDGKPINGINSGTELCDLIVSGLKVNVTKYDSFDYSVIKPAVRNDDDDDDDDESPSDN